MKPNWIAALCGAAIVAVTFSLAVLEGANAAVKNADAPAAMAAAER